MIMPSFPPPPPPLVTLPPPPPAVIGLPPPPPPPVPMQANEQEPQEAEYEDDEDVETQPEEAAEPKEEEHQEVPAQPVQHGAFFPDPDNPPWKRRMSNKRWESLPKFVQRKIPERNRPVLPEKIRARRVLLSFFQDMHKYIKDFSSVHCPWRETTVYTVVKMKVALKLVNARCRFREGVLGSEVPSSHTHPAGGPCAAGATARGHSS